MATRILRILCRMIIGALFVFSGFVKAVDPLGFTYKITDYLEAFQIPWLAGTAFYLAVIMISIELVIGLNMLLGIRVKQTSWFALFFMSLFLILTFYVALENPVTDCGCFGDAIILTNWQTFWKNVIFMVPTLVIFISRRWYRPLYLDYYERYLVVFFVAVSVSICVYSYKNLPLIDFRPYKVGSDIVEGMNIPEGKPHDKYETYFVYEKDGIQKEFHYDSIDWTDTVWTKEWKWVETQNILIEKGYEPPIHDFVFTDEYDYDITQEILQDSGYIFMMIAYDLEKASEKGLEKINDLALASEAKGIKFIGATSSTNSEIETFKSNYQPVYPITVADEIMLKTIIRSNPGLILIKDGTIIGKWHYRHMPKVEMIKENMTSAVLSQNLAVKHRNRVSILVFLIIVILILQHFWAPINKTYKVKI